MRAVIVDGAKERLVDSPSGEVGGHPLLSVQHIVKGMVWPLSENWSFTSTRGKRSGAVDEEFLVLEVDRTGTGFELPGEESVPGLEPTVFSSEIGNNVGLVLGESRLVIAG